MADDGLACPRCRATGRHEVIDSRPASGVIRRRRRCAGCGHRFNTYEVDGTAYWLLAGLDLDPAAVRAAAKRAESAVDDLQRLVRRGAGRDAA
ncbi:MAG: hypothetical protein AB7O57_21975 [Hyphomicrobiaceae bacterium]